MSAKSELKAKKKAELKARETGDIDLSKCSITRLDDEFFVAKSESNPRIEMIFDNVLFHLLIRNQTTTALFSHIFEYFAVNSKKGLERIGPRNPRIFSPWVKRDFLVLGCIFLWFRWWHHQRRNNNKMGSKNESLDLKISSQYFSLIIFEDRPFTNFTNFPGAILGGNLTNK